MAYFVQLIYNEYLEKFLAVSRQYFSMERDGQAPAEPRADGFEIVQVIGGFKLLDEVSHERIYWRRDGAPLVPGFYFVRVTAGISARKFNEDAVFRGPFRRRQDAGDALQRFKVRIPFNNRRLQRVPDRPRVAA